MNNNKIFESFFAVLKLDFSNSRQRKNDVCIYKHSVH